MALYKRPGGKIWWVRFTDPNGNEVRRSSRSRSKKEAQEFHDRLKSEFWRQQQLGEMPRRTWQEAVERWYEEKQEKASIEHDLTHFNWLHPHLSDLFLDEIDSDLIRSIREARRSEGVANSTINRTMQAVRGVLRRCVEWDWLHRSPTVRMLPEGSPRIRWLTRDEADRLLSELPEHVAEMVRFTLATGLREANVTGLEWSQVDLSRRIAWIHADQAKARKPIAVPLNRQARLVLRRQIGKHPERVFTYQGNPIEKAGSTAWNNALKRAGIGDFRWHDLRHTWASWHVQQGTPLPVLQQLGGWKTIQMVMRYAHLAPDHLAPYAEKLADLRTISGTVGKKRSAS